MGTEPVESGTDIITAARINDLIDSINNTIRNQNLLSPVQQYDFIRHEDFQAIANTLIAINADHHYCASDGSIEQHNGGQPTVLTSNPNDYQQNGYIYATDINKLQTDTNGLTAQCSCDGHGSQMECSCVGVSCTCYDQFGEFDPCLCDNECAQECVETCLCHFDGCSTDGCQIVCGCDAECTVDCSCDTQLGCTLDGGGPCLCDNECGVNCACDSQTCNCDGGQACSCDNVCDIVCSCDEKISQQTCSCESVWCSMYCLDSGRYTYYTCSCDQVCTSDCSCDVQSCSLDGGGPCLCDNQCSVNCSCHSESCNCDGGQACSCDNECGQDCACDNTACSCNSVCATVCSCDSEICSCYLQCDVEGCYIETCDCDGGQWCDTHYCLTDGTGQCFCEANICDCDQVCNCEYGG